MILLLSLILMMLVLIGFLIAEIGKKNMDNQTVISRQIQQIQDTAKRIENIESASFAQLLTIRNSTCKPMPESDDKLTPPV